MPVESDSSSDHLSDYEHQFCLWKRNNKFFKKKKKIFKKYELFFEINVWFQIFVDLLPIMEMQIDSDSSSELTGSVYFWPSKVAGLNMKCSNSFIKRCGGGGGGG